MHPGFTLASFLCGTATSPLALVVFRIVQGAFGGGLIATSQIVLRDTFPPEKLAASSALFAIALTVDPALGPTPVGFLTDNLSLQWVFDIKNGAERRPRRLAAAARAGLRQTRMRDERLTWNQGETEVTPDGGG